MTSPTIPPDEFDGMTLEEQALAYEQSQSRPLVKQCPGCGVTMAGDRRWCRFCSAIQQAGEEETVTGA